MQKNKTRRQNKSNCTGSTGSSAGPAIKTSQSVPSKTSGGSREQVRQEEGEADKLSHQRGAAGAARTPSQSSKKGEGSVPPLPEPEDVVLGVTLKQTELEAVEKLTRGQRNNPKWFAWRKNRITASIAHRVSHSRFVSGSSQTPPASYLASIVGDGPHVMTRAMAWGVNKESVAARRYQKLKSEELRRAVSVRDCGLFIHPQKSWLAASPDGIVEIPQISERLLLEIKCPFKHRENTVAQACREDRSFCLKLADGPCPYQLKQEHSYYTQVQCQMAVVGIHKADFVVYTQRETAIVPVTFDPHFWASVEDKLEMFYMKAVVPHVRVNPAFQREL
ncbi:uncharacterized protein LOC125711423 [Brienomyrus brachyistius]|uniref:uncharacterized protein LOC125711423 n=1 Tax=Brienomyrus brachyistius TaxID=42636 RepID=UPI0020B299D0|nr:uncharacterized protein LOC125711423 [Brienomyrus brachyistius]